MIQPWTMFLAHLKGNLNPGNPTELILYLQDTKEIDKEYEKLDI